jgi:hypothetical protein
MCHKLTISLNYYRNIPEPTNLLQVDKLITNKFLTISEASRRILNTMRIKTYVLVNVKHF